MFQRIIDGLSRTTGSAMRLTSLALATGIALFVTIAFLCAAAFVFVLQRYGLVAACLTGAAVFFIVTLIGAGFYMAHRTRLEREAAQAAEAAKSATQSFLTDPMVRAAGLQAVRAIGIKRLIPLLAVGGLALGLMASRAGTSRDVSSEPAE
ncbi:MAG: hypothetical protein HY852_23060 [Bradyrhizobium sp.]|uniref:hypothetical protein n=1 Tax=Bradyrhizobium sp. TaxID=376 RepID=UPI0025B7D9A2|nr:hypothetical protein [Bradyrhizobium sp.]MBI5264686.1 hypothetical protein [Bradyrhizobium sp.]